MIERSGKGLSLVDLMIAIFLMAILVLAISRTFLSVEKVSLNSRMQLRASRLVDMIQTRYSVMWFGYVLPVDSRLPNFGLPVGATYPQYSTQTVGGVDTLDAWNNTVKFSTSLPQTKDYPEMPVLNEILGEVRSAGFSDFVVKVTPMRRDFAAGNALVPYKDVAPVDNVDDSDPNVYFNDFNNDGDTVDFFWRNGSVYESERPNTHLLQLEISVLKKNETMVSRRGQLLSLEYMGMGSKGHSTFSAEAAYGISITNMPFDGKTTLFEMNSPDSAIKQGESDGQGFNGFGGKDNIKYPIKVVGVQADVAPSSKFIHFVGSTETGATVEVRLNPIVLDPILDTFLVKTKGGKFSFDAPNLNNKLVLGWNQFALRAVKGQEFSAFAVRNVIKDDRSPKFLTENPINKANVHTLTPFVEVPFIDPPAPSTTVVSGICAESIRFQVKSKKWDDVDFEFSPGHGNRVLWVDPNTSLPPLLTNGQTYLWRVEGGDNAGYKTSTSAGGNQFTINLLGGITPPTCDIIATVIEPIVVFKITVNDDNNGVNLYTFELDLGPKSAPSSPVVSILKTPHLGQYFERLPGSPGGAVFNYTYPTSLLSKGANTVYVRVKNHQGISFNTSADFVIN